jgi:outer membrane lipoprotein
MLSRRIAIGIGLLMCGFLPACASQSAVPKELQSQVDHSVTFVELKQAPDQYRGHTVVLGGEVLSAKRLKEGTRIEVLQLPLDSYLQPGWERTASEGRFIAFEKQFLDPAKLPPGTRVTITGDVTGSIVAPLDETEYTYPTLDAKNVTVWPKHDPAYAQPYYPGYYGRPYGYWGGSRWGPWGPYPYGPYWW